MAVTKAQEREALERIKKIVADLGADSYIGTAFEGCFEIAEINIDNDWALSMKQRVDKAETDLQNARVKAEAHGKTIKRLTDDNKRLAEQLETEQEWTDYEMKENVSQSDYDNLIKGGGTRFLTDDEAKDILYDWYGFAKEKVTIHSSVPTYQINRHRRLRRTGEAERRAAYNSTDWNYIRFDCGAMTYELINDNLQFFVH